MIDWGYFNGFFSTGIPSIIFYPSLLVTVVLLIVGFIFDRVKNKRNYGLWVLLTEYTFVVVCSTVICRERMYFTFERLELTPFWTYYSVMHHTFGVSVWDIILNVVLFIPLGFLVKLVYPAIPIGKMLLIAFGCSVLIEMNQFFWEKGAAQIDDVMHNTIGAGIGWVIAKLVQGAWFLLCKRPEVE